MREASANSISAIKKWAIYLSPTLLLFATVYGFAYQPPKKLPPAPIAQNPFASSNQSPYTVVSPSSPVQTSVQMLPKPVEPLPLALPSGSEGTIASNSTPGATSGSAAASKKTDNHSTKAYKNIASHSRKILDGPLDLTEKVVDSTLKTASGLLHL